MNNLLVLALCLGAGFLLRSKVDPRPFSVYVLYLALPAVAYTSLRTAPAVSWPAVASVWLVFGVSWGFFTLVGRALGWTPATVGCLTLACGLSNTSFVGFPLLEAVIGPAAIPVAVPLDQLGSFLLVASVAPIVGARASAPFGLGRQAPPASPALRDRARRPTPTGPPLLSRTRSRASGRTWDLRQLLAVLRFPALPAMLLAFLLPDAPAPLVSALERIGGTLSPVALFAIGAQLRLPPPAERGPLAIGLTWKLAAAPLLVFGWMRLFHAEGLALEVPVLEAGMAPMVTGVLLAQSMGLRPELAAAAVGIGVPISVATVWGWAMWVS